MYQNELLQFPKAFKKAYKNEFYMNQIFEV